MKTEERINQQKQLVEIIGLRHEQEGGQPVAGRIMGLLMVMDKEQYTFDEIVEELQISKSSASVALKMLQLRNLVEYVTYTGDRRRYFRVRSQEPFHLINELEKSLIEKKQIMERIVSLKANPESRNSEFFRNLIDITDFFLGKFESLRKEYLKNK